MTFNTTLSPACHSERSEESALLFLAHDTEQADQPLLRIANAIKAARRVLKAPPERAGTQDLAAKASRPSYTPTAHVPCLRTARKSHPFRRKRPIPSDSHSWSAGKHRAIHPACPASRKSSLARKENPIGRDRATALSKSTR